MESEKSLGQFVCSYLPKYLDRHICESENTSYNFFAHFTNLNIPVTIFKYLQKAYLQIWKYLGQFVCSYLFKYLEKPIYESENTWHIFRIFKKVYWQILKNVGLFFCSYLFQIFKKTYLWIWKHLREFSNIEKSILMNLKLPETIFLLIPVFKYLKSILRNLKIPRTVFLLVPFSNI